MKESIMLLIQIFLWNKLITKTNAKMTRQSAIQCLIVLKVMDFQGPKKVSFSNFRGATCEDVLE